MVLTLHPSIMASLIRKIRSHLGVFIYSSKLFGMHLAFSIITKPYRIILQTLTGFLNRFGKTPTDRHYFPNAFHLQTKGIVGPFEFIKIPAGHFYDHIVKRRFKIGGSGLGDLVFQFIEMISDSQFGCNLCNRVSCCFGGQGRRTAYTRGFISTGIISSVSGFSANCTLQPPAKFPSVASSGWLCYAYLKRCIA